MIVVSCGFNREYNSGARLAMKAAIPSAKLGLLAVISWLRFSSAIAASRLLASMPIASPSLVIRRPIGEAWSRSSTHGCAAASNWSSGTTSATSPTASARCASNEPPGQHQFRRNRSADQARQEIANAHVAGGQPDADEGRVHPRAFPGDPDVAGERKSKPAAAGCAMDQRDNRLRAAPHLDIDIGQIALKPEAATKWHCAPVDGVP